MGDMYDIWPICIYVYDCGIIPKEWPVIIIQIPVSLLIKVCYYLGHFILIQHHGGGFYVDLQTLQLQKYLGGSWCWWYGSETREWYRKVGRGLSMMTYSAEKCPLDTVFWLFGCLLIILWCCSAKYWFVPANVFSSLLYKA